MARKINIKDFHEIEVRFPNLNKIVYKHSLDTANDLRRNPYQKWETHRLRPQYDAGWRIEMTEDNKKRTIGTVYNKRRYMMTWLLENGHFIVNKVNGVGWAAPHPHIKPSFDVNSQKFVQDMKTNLNVDVQLK